MRTAARRINPLVADLIPDIKGLIPDVKRISGEADVKGVRQVRVLVDLVQVGDDA